MISLILQLDPSELGYQIPYIFTLVLIITKFLLTFFLLNKIKVIKKESDHPSIEFISAMLLVMISLFISRIIYFYFDFYLTYFDPDQLWRSPQVWVWKAGNLTAALGIASIIYVLDKKIYEFKFKGSFALLLVIVSIIQFVYPINSKDDFNIVSSIGIIGTVSGLIIPVTFFRLGFKSSGDVRKIAFMIAWGILIYALSAQLMSEQILEAIGEDVNDPGRLVIVALVPLIKCVGLAMLAYAITKFRV
jgi:hypothetical protein